MKRKALKDNILNSFTDLIKSLEAYHETSIKYRTVLRKGCVLLLGDKKNISKSVKNFINDDDLNIVEVKDKKDIIEKLNKLNGQVKTVIVDSNYVDYSENGNSLPSYINKKYPRIPVWILNTSKNLNGISNSSIYRPHFNKI